METEDPEEQIERGQAATSASSGMEEERPAARRRKAETQGGAAGRRPRTLGPTRGKRPRDRELAEGWEMEEVFARGSSMLSRSWT